MTGVPEFVLRRRERVVEMTFKGMSATEIAGVLGITDRSVIRHRKAAGITRGVCPDRMPPEAFARAEELFDDGCSISEVARTIGYNARTVRKHFPGRGWTREQFCDYISTIHRCKVRFEKHTGVFVK